MTQSKLVRVGLLVLSAACSAGLDVDDVRGIYRATTANGKALPTPVIGDAGNRLVAGRLELRSSDSLLLVLEGDSGVDTLSARFTLSGDELHLTEIDAAPRTLVDRVRIVSSRSVVLTVVYHFAPSSGLPANWPVEIVFWR